VAIHELRELPFAYAKPPLLWIPRALRDRIYAIFCGLLHDAVQPRDAEYANLLLFHSAQLLLRVPPREGGEIAEGGATQDGNQSMGQDAPVANEGDVGNIQGVVAQGGEGLVLHHWDALWQPGRSKAVRKLKPQPDEEGRVIALVPGKGQFKGQMGGLLLETPDKKRFTLGTGFSQADRRTPPPVGSWVTYRYRDRTPQGIPRFASFLRVRGEE
jgi:hypothetical protein